jgi:chorismate dehydratase
MIRLGHIDYSNCIPVHALLLEAPPADVRLVRDIPSALNRALAAGEIDAAPCSSIEYARHAADYRILPLHAIGSAGAVRSILLETSIAPHDLDGRVVAVPTASATSVVLLRILLETRLGVRPRLHWYEQGPDTDPGATGATGGVGAAAVLRIGDVALRRAAAPGRAVYDLGTEWTSWTGLPFAFAVWQVRRGMDRAAVRRLAGLLAESRQWFAANRQRLAARHAPVYGLAPERLLEYWASLRFDLDADMQRGLLHFYRLAAELGEAPETTTLDIVGLP